MTEAQLPQKTQYISEQHSKLDRGHWQQGDSWLNTCMHVSAHHC